MSTLPAGSTIQSVRAQLSRLRQKTENDSIMIADATPPPVVRVGVTGHRKLGADPLVWWYVHAQCVRLLDRFRDLARLRRAELVACSALAIGADQLFAEAALGLGIPLVSIIPFENYPADFEDADRARFDALLERCRAIERLPFKQRSHHAYLQAGKWVVNEVDYLVAVWDGRPAAGKGGTGDIVAYAARKKRPIFRIDPAAAGVDDTLEG